MGGLEAGLRDRKYEGGFLIRLNFPVCDLGFIALARETLGSGTAALAGVGIREMVVEQMRRACKFEDCIGRKGSLYELH